MSQKAIKEIAERYERATYMIHRRLSSKVREVIPNDMTSEQMFILRYLKNNTQGTSTELADLLYVEKSTITSITNRLVNKGYITRSTSEDDRRVVYLTITPLGSSVHDNLEDDIFRMIQPYIEKVGVDCAFEYIKVLELAAKLFEDDKE